MLSLKEILPYYPESLHAFKQFMLREYLQYKILQILFDRPENATRLCFLGGTSLRIVHGNQRFSEDLDFDNTGLTEKAFESLSDQIKDELQREGYNVEITKVIRGAYHCHIKFPGLLFAEGLSGQQAQKILIQLDTEPQDYDFKPEMHILNKFDVFTEIPVAALSLTLAQKFWAVLNRKRSKGRDFFDVAFLLSKKIIPDYDYLDLKAKIRDAKALKEKVLARCANLDMKEMADDVAPFLFNSKDTKNIVLFEKLINQTEL
ncbi:MAG: nucleotidyl transferase AbiEii/AbiGii toxin family protein [Bacteroidia bacterium]|nr:nucleotidyl transferase AbiEii/AbiGii toxin family protein [Bacteroidia bacterium]